MKIRVSLLKKLLGVVFSGVLFLSCCALASCRASRPILGVWWWSDSLGEEYLDFADKNGVTEIYYCSSKFNESTDTFLEKAEKRRIKVFWLAGEYQWVENASGCIAKIERFNAYQQNYAHRFSGIHFDIEPQQHPEFGTRRVELITAFVQLVYDLKAQYPDTWIEYDIPFWMENEITVNQITKPAYAHVIDCASRVTLMSYRDKAENIYSVSSAEIAYAKEMGKKLNLGVLTKSSEGDQVSFMEEGRAVMCSEIARLRTMIPSDYGVVIHQIKHWYDMKA